LREVQTACGPLEKAADTGEFGQPEEVRPEAFRIQLQHHAVHRARRGRMGNPRMGDPRADQAKITGGKRLDTVPHVAQAGPLDDPSQLDLRVLVPWPVEGAHPELPDADGGNARKGHGFEGGGRGRGHQNGPTMILSDRQNDKKLDDFIIPSVESHGWSGP
jgi:hypothetical protein